MLIVHPSSRCDVCLDGYHWTTPANAPHAIYCGHIFCKTCLAALEQPSTCPLCRKPFALDKVKKLIVDRVSSTSDESQAMGGGRDEASVLLEQIALVSGEDTPADQAAQILSGAQQWLEVQPEAPSHRVLKAAVSALTRFRETHAKHTALKADYKTLKHHYKKKQRAWDQDKTVWEGSEKSLMAERDEALETVARLEKVLAAAKVHPSMLQNAGLSVGLGVGLGLVSDGNPLKKHVITATSLGSALGPPEKKPLKSAMKFTTYQSPFASESSSDDSDDDNTKTHLDVKQRRKKHDPTKAPRIGTSSLLPSPSPALQPSISAPMISNGHGHGNGQWQEGMDRARSMMPTGSGVRSADSSFDMGSVGDTSFGSTHSHASTTLSSVASTSSLTDTHRSSRDRERSREPSSSSSFEPGSLASSFSSASGMHYPGHMHPQASNSNGNNSSSSNPLMDKWIQENQVHHMQPQPQSQANVAQQQPIEQPLARPAGEANVPSWAQPISAPGPGGLRRHATTSSNSIINGRRGSGDSIAVPPRQDSRGSSRSQRSARSAVNTSSTTTTRSPALAHATAATPTAPTAASSTAQGQGLGSLGLYSVPSSSHQIPAHARPSRVRDDSDTVSALPTQRRTSRRSRNGSATDTEGLGPSLTASILAGASGRQRAVPLHRGVARVQAVGMARESSAPGATTGSGTTMTNGAASGGAAAMGRQGLTSMSSFADLGLVSLPPALSGSGSANTSQSSTTSNNAATSTPADSITTTLRERPGARDNHPPRPDSVASTSSWGTMGTPSPRHHSLSMLDLDIELSQVRTPPAPPPGELRHHGRSESLPGTFPGQGSPLQSLGQASSQAQGQAEGGQRTAAAQMLRTPGPRVARLLAGQHDDDEGLQTPRNRQNELDGVHGHHQHVRPRGHSESDAHDAHGGGLGLSLSAHPTTTSAPTSTNVSAATSPALPNQAPQASQAGNPSARAAAGAVPHPPSAPPRVRTTASAPGPPTAAEQQGGRPHLQQRATTAAALPSVQTQAQPAHPHPVPMDRPAAYRTMTQQAQVQAQQVAHGQNISPPHSVAPQAQQVQQQGQAQQSFHSQAAPPVLHPNLNQAQQAAATYYAQHPRMGPVPVQMQGMPMQIAPGQAVPMQMVQVQVQVPGQPQPQPVSAPRAQRRHTMTQPSYAHAPQQQIVYGPSMPVGFMQQAQSQAGAHMTPQQQQQQQAQAQAQQQMMMMNTSTPWQGQVPMSAHTPYVAPPQLNPRS